MESTDLKAIRRQMAALGRRREKARAEAFRLTQDLKPLVCRAHELGMQITEIAGITGLSRPAIYKLLGE